MDTINLNLKNNSNFDAAVGLRCGSFLEMFYQKKQDGDWSDNLWFWYMPLLCPTHLDTIERNTTFEYSIPTEIIDSTGTFRLLVDVHILKRDTNVTVFSNTFKIE